MPVEFWIDEEADDLFYWTFEGRWTISEFECLNRKAAQLIAECHPKQVYGIADLTDSAPPPVGFLLLMQKLDAGPENWGATVMIAKSPIIISVVNVLSHVNPGFRKHFKLVQTMEEARCIIRSLRDEADAGSG
jgi:hypothetical protein